MLDFFTKSSSLIEFQIGFVWYGKESLCKSIHSMLGFLKALFFILHFSYYTLITFLMMLSLILLSMLMILLSMHLYWFVTTTRVGFCNSIWPMRHCRLGQEVAFLFQYPENSTCFMLEKLNLFHLTSQINLVLLMWKWMGLFSKKDHYLKCWDFFFFENRLGPFTLSLLLKLSPKKLEPWFVLWNFFLMRLLFISTTLPHGLPGILLCWGRSS